MFAEKNTFRPCGCRITSPTSISLLRFQESGPSGMLRLVERMVAWTGPGDSIRALSICTLLDVLIDLSKFAIALGCTDHFPSFALAVTWINL